MKSGARTVDALVRAQRRQLGLDGSLAIATTAQAATFVARVAIALRYGPNDALPLASMYRACAVRDSEDDQAVQRRATLITNELVERRAVVEVNCVADRVALAGRAVVPALVALRRRGRAIDELEVSEAARRVLD